MNMNPEIGALAQALIARQNPDGGWGYGGPTSWVEPTAYAILALSGIQDTFLLSAGRWLDSMKLPDGGWRPAAAVDQATWVGALAILARKRTGISPDEASVRWLLDQTGQESSWIHRLRSALLGARQEQSVEFAGWPWFPGAAAWVMPTALTILALQRVTTRGALPEVSDRIREAQRFLLARACVDGGWNHGSPRALGQDASSYPETTGVALLALQGFGSDRLAAAVSRARRHLSSCRARVAAAWLQLGLSAVGTNPAELKAPTTLLPRNVSDIAITLLAERALEGDNVLLA